MNRENTLTVLPAVDMVKVQRALNEIKISHTKSVASIMETAELLHQYKLSEEWYKISELLDQENIMKDSVQKYYIGIAQNPILMNSEYWHQLPPFYNNLYQLSRIKGDTLQKMIETGKIHPSITLEDTREFAEKYSPLKKNAYHVTQKKVGIKINIEITFQKKYSSQKQIDFAVTWLENNLTDAIVKLK